MIELSPVVGKTFEDILNNIPEYKEKFIKESVIVFRDANLSFDQQKQLHEEFGKEFGWYTHKANDSHYLENHSHNRKISKSGPDDILLVWHVEHVNYSNPIVAGTWNMFNFSEDSNSGKTYFVDTSLVYELLETNMKKFLDNCILTTGTIKGAWPFSLTPEYPAIAKHWLTDKPVIRIPLDHILDTKIDSVNGHAPTREDYLNYRNIATTILSIVKNNKEIKIVHKWKQGDLVLMDAFKLAHAVTGGFKPENREFTGIWGYQYEIYDDTGN